MRSLLALAIMTAVAIVLGLGACKTTPTAPTPAIIYSELVEAGCIQADDSGLASVTAGMTSDAQPPWFTCLSEGGTVSGCGVPCDASIIKSKK